MCNIEIKAKIDDPEALIARIKESHAVYYAAFEQHDTFFNVSDGKLKLREFEHGCGELIYYKRSDTIGPKLSSYERTSLDERACVGIRKVLTRSNGCIGIVKKTRNLYLIGQTRIHVDKVDGLGHFMELEVVLKDDQDVETGEKIAEDLMITLGIESHNLIAEAYIDLLNKVDVSS